jgi:hypothetical protein
MSGRERGSALPALDQFIRRLPQRRQPPAPVMCDYLCTAPEAHWPFVGMAMCQNPDWTDHQHGWRILVLGIASTGGDRSV